MYTFPDDDLALLVSSDANSDLHAYTFDNTNWTDVNPTGGNITASLSSITSEPFIFAFKNFLGDSLIIKDIIPIYNNQEFQNIEPGSNITVNVSVRDLDTSNFTFDVTLQLINPNGVTVYPSNTVYGKNITNGSTVLVNFSNIDTTGWAPGSYEAIATVTWDGGSNTLTEPNSFIISQLSIFPVYPLGLCLNVNS
jgi:hypothetical protein